MPRCGVPFVPSGIQGCCEGVSVPMTDTGLRCGIDAGSMTLVSFKTKSSLNLNTLVHKAG